MTKLHEINTQLIQAKSQAETELKEVINNANEESTKFKEELEDVHKEVVKLSERVNNIKESNTKLQAENKDLKVENEKLRHELQSAQITMENKRNVVVHSERGNGLSIQTKAAEMETELYKTLLDIALNKIKFLEECASSKTPSKLYIPSANRGRFVLRVSETDPTDMFMENIDGVKLNDSKEHDGQSLSSVSTADDVSIDKRASITSSVNISDLFGSQASLNSSQGMQQPVSSSDSIIRDQENGKNTNIVTDSSDLSRIRSLSMNGDDNHEASESRPLLRDRKDSSNDNRSKRTSLPIDLIDGADNFLIDPRSRSLHSQDNDSICSGISSTLSTHSHTLSTNSQEDKVKETKSKDKSHARQTVKDVKRKKSDSKSTSTHMLTLQKLHKYRSVGEIFKGMRKTSKEEPVYGSHEHLHKESIDDGKSKGRRLTQPVMRRNTMDGDIQKPKLKQYRRASSNQEFPVEPEKRHSVSNDPNKDKDDHEKPVSTGVSPAVSSDNVSNTRTSGFVALRQRRNGFVMDSNDFKDISKHLKKKSKSSNDFSSILRRFSRDNMLNNEEDGEDEPQAVKPRRRSRLSSSKS